MNFTNLTKDAAIRYHLSLNHKVDDSVTIFSTLTAVLRDCRMVTRRDIRNGERASNLADDRSDSWLGTMGYMTVLDQIGKCYRPSSISQVTGHSITKALQYFCHLNARERASIYALRCAFSHDYSLYNICKGKRREELTQHFTVSGHGYNKLIILPKEPWDGKHNTKTATNGTVVNLPMFGDLVEGILKKLNEYLEQGRLELEITPRELIDRYVVFIHRQT